MRGRKTSLLHPQKRMRETGKRGGGRKIAQYERERHTHTEGRRRRGRGGRQNDKLRKKEIETGQTCMRQKTENKAIRETDGQ